MGSPFALAPSFPASVRPPTSHDCLSTAATGPVALKSCIVLPLSLFSSRSGTKRASSRRASSRMTTIRCDVAVQSADSVNAEADPSLSPSSEEKATVGSRVRVTAPLKVYHVNRVPEVELQGMEGKLKDYVALWKGKRISANLPYKVEFFKEIQGRGPVKFVAHLKEDEFEFIDPS